MNNSYFVYFCTIAILTLAGVLLATLSKTIKIKHRQYYWITIILILAVNVISVIIKAPLEWLVLLFFAGYLLTMLIGVQQQD